MKVLMENSNSFKKIKNFKIKKLKFSPSNKYCFFIISNFSHKIFIFDLKNFRIKEEIIFLEKIKDT